MVRPTLAWAIVLLTVVLIGLCESSHASAQSEPVRKRNRDGYYTQRGATYRNIAGIPRPITTVDVDRWSWMMHLSDAQVEQLRALYGRYVDREQGVHNEHIQPLWDRSAEIVHRGSVARNLSLAEEFALLVKTDRRRGVRQLVRAEEQLFNELEPHLNETQVPLLGHVRAQRERSRNNRRNARYVGGDVDLTILLWMLYGKSLELSPDKVTALESLITEYDAATTLLFARRQKAILDIASEGSILLASRLSMGRVVKGSDRWVRANGLRMKTKQLRRKLVHVEKRILNQNVLYLNAMADILPERQARGLIGAFQQLVYEPVYPDPTDVGHLFDELFGLDSLSMVQRSEVEAVRVLIEVRQETLCERMIRRYLEWREFQGIEWGLPAGAFQAYEQDMRDLDSKREENAQLAIALVTDILLPEQSDELAKTISSSLSRIRDHQLIVDRRFHQP